jgi:AraC-like DNA-binding protein
MAGSVELPVSMPGLRAVRWTTASLHAGMKDYYAVGRIEHGRTEWWGGGKVWRSAPGCIVVKQPGDVHRDLARDGATTWTVITLPANDVARVRDEGKVTALPQLEAKDERAAPFHRLHDAVCAGADRLSLEVALAEAVSAFAVISSANPGHTRPVRRAMEYLRERLADSITLEDLAVHANLDKFHLCRAFRAQIGMPPHAYLTHLRIARAKELLLLGVRASDVAPLVGLYDQSQLTRHFRRIVGTTPARYGKMRPRPSITTSTALTPLARADAP